MNATDPLGSEQMGSTSHVRCIQPCRSGLLHYLLRLISGFVAQAAKIRDTVRVHPSGMTPTLPCLATLGRR